MKSRIAFIFISFVTLFSTFGGPFGLKMGMSLSEVAEACGGETPEYITDDRYLIHPVKTHPLFESYVVWVDNSEGLYYVKATSDIIKTNDYGTSVKNKFSNLTSSLKKKYGICSYVDEVAPDSIYKDEQDWMRSIFQGARKYQAWFFPLILNSEKFSDIDTIMVEVGALNTLNAYITIEYWLSNKDSIQNKIDDNL